MKILNLFVSIVALALLSGCGTIYSAAVDERNVKTIAKDSQIKGIILKEFLEDKAIKTLDISVGCYFGHVYLIGEYDQLSQKDRAYKIAKNVEGVTQVTAYLLPKKEDPNCGTTENLELMARVKAKLIGDKKIWSTNIDVKSMQCMVVLSGYVGTKAEIQKAVAHAKSVPGVRSVKSYLKSKR